MRYETSNVDIGAKLKIEGDLVDTVQRRRLSYFGCVARVCTENVVRPSCYMDMLQDRQQEEDLGGSGLITFVMTVPIWV